MTAPNLNWIANCTWGIGDDLLRDVYLRGKYRDVILPMTALRRLEAGLEPTKKAVLDTKATLDASGVTNQDPTLRHVAGRAFQNTSWVTLSDLRGESRKTTTHGRLRGLPRRILAQCAGHPRLLSVPEPDPEPRQGRRTGFADLAGNQPRTRSGVGHRRRGSAPRPQQPRHRVH